MDQVEGQFAGQADNNHNYAGYEGHVGNLARFYTVSIALNDADMLFLKVKNRNELSHEGIAQDDHPFQCLYFEADDVGCALMLMHTDI